MDYRARGDSSPGNRPDIRLASLGAAQLLVSYPLINRATKEIIVAGTNDELERSSDRRIAVLKLS